MSFGRRTRDGTENRTEKEELEIARRIVLFPLSISVGLKRSEFTFDTRLDGRMAFNDLRSRRVK